MKKLELVLLGQPDFKLDGETVNDLVLRKGLALLAYLAVTKQAHSREALAGLLWGEMTEANARRNLRVVLARLRPYFKDHLIIQRRSLAFDMDSDYQLDVEIFEHALNQPNPTAVQLQTAVDLYRGSFLADFPLRDAPMFEEWIRPYQERLRQMGMDALYRLAVINTQEHQYAQGIDNLGKLLILEPWMEEAHRQMMLLLALSGQRSSALTQFETCQTVLEEELGVEPSEATCELYEKIINEEIKPDDSRILPAPPAAPIAIPFQAHATKQNFVGRAAVLSEIENTLTTTNQHLIDALVGMGGVGKSTLALQLAHVVRSHFVDGVLWANAATSEPLSILESWAQLYGYDFSRITDLESMSAAFRSVLVDKCVLIILDDVSSISRIKALLPTGSHNRVLLTTRDHDLARSLDAQVWLLQELSQENGRLLFASILGEKRINDEPEAATEICDLLENLPLAVEIIGQRLKSRPRRRLADVAQRLRGEAQRLSELQISDRAVRASFALSYQSLDVQLRRMLALMGMFNGRSFSAEALAAIAELDRYEAEDRIFALTALSLAQEDGQTRYKQHALLADFALEKLGDEGEVEYGRLAQYYLHFAQQNQTNYDTLHPEWDNLMAAMETAYTHQIWQTVIDFADALHDAWFTRGRFTQARQGYRWVYEAATGVQEKLKIMTSLRFLGLACIEQRDYDEARNYLTASLELATSQSELSKMAAIKGDFAKFALETGDYHQAQQFLEDSRYYCEQIDNIEGVAETYYTEARLAYFQGDYDKAIRLAENALQMQDPLNDQKGAILTLNLLASTLNELDDYFQAEVCALKALEMCQQLQDKSEQSMILDVLAGAYIGQKEFDLAHTHAQRSLEMLKGMGDLRSQAQVLHRLSMIKQGQAQLKEALEKSQQSLTLCRELNYRLLMGPVLMYMGDIQKQLGDLDQAIATWKEGMKIAELLKHPKLILKLRQRIEMVNM